MKLTVKVAVCPGFRVSGKLTPEMLKPDPVTLPALIVSGAVPEEVRVTDWVEVEFTVTSPKLRLLALKVSVGEAAPRLMA